MGEGIPSAFIGTVLLASLISCGGSKEGKRNVYQGLLTELIAGDYKSNPMMMNMRVDLSKVKK